MKQADEFSLDRRTDSRLPGQNGGKDEENDQMYSITEPGIRADADNDAFSWTNCICVG